MRPMPMPNATATRSSGFRRSSKCIGSHVIFMNFSCTMVFNIAKKWPEGFDGQVLLAGPPWETLINLRISGSFRVGSGCPFRDLRSSQRARSTQAITTSSQHSSLLRAAAELPKRHRCKTIEYLVGQMNRHRSQSSILYILIIWPLRSSKTPCSPP